ncbi:hypothetical protein ACO0QE_001370 [Hanseniaspora vineae]
MSQSTSQNGEFEPRVNNQQSDGALTPEVLTNEGFAYVAEHTLQTILSQSAREQEAETLDHESSVFEQRFLIDDTVGPTDTAAQTEEIQVESLHHKPVVETSASTAIDSSDDEEAGEQREAQGEEAEDEDEISTKWYRDTVNMYKNKKWYQRPTAVVLFVALALKALSFTIMITPTAALTMEKICDSMRDDQGHCNMSTVQKEQSVVQSAVSFITSCLGLVTAGKYGELSDRRGRVFVLQINGIITLVHVLLALYVFAPGTTYNRYGLIFVNSIEAISGGVMVLISTGNAYISDIVPVTQRMVSISVLMSIVYGSLGLGPLMSSFTVKLFNGNNFTPFYLAVLCCLLFNAMVFYFIIESRYHDARRYSQSEQFMKQQIHGTSVYRKLFEVVEPLKHLWMPKTYSGSLVPRINVILLMFLDVIFVMATQGAAPTLVLYAMLRFHWGAVELGYYLSISGLGRAVVLLLLVPQVVSMLKKSTVFHFKSLSSSMDRLDLVILQWSVFCIFVSIAVAVFVQSSSSGLYFSAVIQAFSAVISPTIQSVVVKYASKKITGQVFGAIALFRHIVMLIMPLIFLRIYSETVDKNPAIFLYVPLVGSIIGFVLTFFLKIVEDPQILRRPSEVVFLNKQELTPLQKEQQQEQQRMERRKSSISSGSNPLKIKRSESIHSLEMGKGFVFDTVDAHQNASASNNASELKNNKRNYNSIMERRPSVLDQR